MFEKLDIEHADCSFLGGQSRHEQRRPARADREGRQGLRKKAGIASARRVIAAADSSKLGHTACAHVGPAALVHTLVTDTTAAAGEVTALEADGTVVRTV